VAGPRPDTAEAGPVGNGGGILVRTGAQDPAGTAITPASRPVPVTHHTTMPMVCLGVIPTALNTPRSSTRSLVCRTMMFSTPRAAPAGPAGPRRSDTVSGFMMFLS
jgi:hypothetical protein